MAKRKHGDRRRGARLTYEDVERAYPGAMISPGQASADAPIVFDVDYDDRWFVVYEDGRIKGPYKKALPVKGPPPIGTPAGKDPMPLFLRDKCRNALLNTKAGQALYSDYKDRCDPGGIARFSFSDTVYFALIAAASGIIGNFSYDVVKTLVRRCAKKEQDAKQDAEEQTSTEQDAEEQTSTDLEVTYQQVVRQTTYEELLIQQHPDGGCKIEVTTELEKVMESRFNLLVRREPPNK